MASLGRILSAALGVGALTLACSRLSGINATTAGFAYLLLVLALAATWGLREASVASVLAMLCYNYFFLPPVGGFTIADPENWIALFAFLMTALVASHLSERAKRQAMEARQRQIETEQLYALSRGILLTEGTQSIGSRAAQQISQIFEVPGVVLFDAQTGHSYQGGPVELEGLSERLRQVALQGTRFSDDKVEIWPINLGGHSIGALALQGFRTSDGAAQALLNLVAIALERVRTGTAANRAEAARQSEEFKSTLLDAVAHEFKTPLTSIKAAATALLAEPRSLSAETSELLAVIDEETDRLNSLVTEAVRMSQLDAGKIRLEPMALAMEELFATVVGSFGLRTDGRIEMAGGGDERVQVDRELTILAMRQLLDNALKYAPQATPIRVWAERQSEQIVVHVADDGIGIPDEDRLRIFDKFYRHQSVRGKVPGSGMGLHIAREIARMHGGDVWVANGEKGGAEFCLVLPRAGEVVA
jgi:two-component system, OmpR family, sensor histidine kinase KdpD